MNICPDCQHIHPSNAAAAVGRFSDTGPHGYRATYLGAPLRDTRDAAVADWCRKQQGASK